VIPRWVLGAIAAGGLVTGCTLAAGAQGVHAPATPTAGSSEVERLYHDEVALSRHETQLQILLGYARAVLKAQAPVPTSVIAGPVTTTPTPASAGASARPAILSTPAPIHATTSAPLATSVPRATTTTAATTAPPTTTTTASRHRGSDGTDD
jgi:hypothetical protein